MDSAKQDYLTKTEVLNLGWTKTLIQKMLPEPIQKPNPHSRNAAPLKLYLKSDVTAAMQTPEFQTAMKSAEKRRIAAQKAIHTKTERTIAIMTRFADSVQIGKIPESALENLCISSQMNHEAERGNFDFEPPDEETLERWKVNYIRHNLTSYDRNLQHLCGRTGGSRAYAKYKAIILTKIAEAYPSHEKECKRQIERLMQ